MSVLRIVLLTIMFICLTAIVAAASDVKLISTDRIPHAHGVARIGSSQGGVISVDVDASGMKPAVLFGGDYNIFVVWLLSADGKAQNQGEFPLDGDDAHISTVTKAQVRGILVTAEPHFDVSAPSRFVVLANEVSPAFPIVEFESSGTTYNYERSTLAGNMIARHAGSTDVHQALTAYRLAQRAHAEERLGEAFQIVRRALEDTLLLARQKASAEDVSASAREVVRLAARAERSSREDASARRANAAVLNTNGGERFK